MTRGPVYSVELLESLPLETTGGGMRQALPTAEDLSRVYESDLPGTARTAAGYEILLRHYHYLKANQNAPEIKPNAVYTVSDAAVLLRIAENTVRAIAAAGKLSGTRVGIGDRAPWRFTGEQIACYLNGDKTKTPPRRSRRNRAVKTFPGIND